MIASKIAPRVQEVHAAQRAGSRVRRGVRLHEAGLQPRRGELLLAEDAREPAARIAALVELDQHRVLQRGRNEAHRHALRAALCPALRGWAKRATMEPRLRFA